MTRKKKVDIISMNNKPVNKSVQNEPVKVSDKFVKEMKEIKPRVIGKEKKLLVRNGRVYKEIGNGYGIYADSGEVFKI